MSPKPTDQDRLNFLTQFQAWLVYHEDQNVWVVQMGRSQAIGKTPRKAIDEAIKWTRDRSKS